MKLGEVLKSARLASGRSLREVERGTGISNGYLSQLESDAVKQPSPHHLHKLADFYGVDYSRLMDLAGYIAPRQVASIAKDLTTAQFPGLNELPEEDQNKIRQYINDLRDARRIRTIETSDLATMQKRKAS